MDSRPGAIGSIFPGQPDGQSLQFPFRLRQRDLERVRHPGPVELCRGDAVCAGIDLGGFLRILDETEQREGEMAKAVGSEFRHSLAYPCRWQDWAAPDAPERKRLVASTTNAFYDFVNTQLIPHLKTLRSSPNATPRQKVISEIMSRVDRTRIETQRNLLDVLDKIHEISLDTVDDTHVFTLSQVYEGLLLKMGEKGNDGGQFLTPREIIRAVVEVIAPKAGETVCDPCCGTGGFLAQAHEFMRTRLGDNVTGDQIDALKHRTFYGREKENLVYPIALANLVLHGIDEPHIWHGSTLTREEIYSGLYQQAPGQFDVILTNPPFGGKEGAGVKTNLLFFTKGQPTKTIWYYDLSDVKVGKKTPFTGDKLADFFRLLPARGDSDRSWSVDIAERRRKANHNTHTLRATASEPMDRIKKDQEELDRIKSAKAGAARQDAVEWRSASRVRSAKSAKSTPRHKPSKTRLPTSRRSTPTPRQTKTPAPRRGCWSSSPPRTSKCAASSPGSGQGQKRRHELGAGNC